MKIYHLKYPYLNKGNSNIYERNNLLSSLINKQKQLINKSNKFVLLLLFGIIKVMNYLYKSK